MPVLSATDVLSAKLAAMGEHACDLASVIPVARALRDQVEWDRLPPEVADNDFAAAALFLLDRLRIAHESLRPRPSQSRRGRLPHRAIRNSA